MTDTRNNGDDGITTSSGTVNVRITFEYGDRHVTKDAIHNAIIKAVREVSGARIVGVHNSGAVIVNGPREN